MDLLYMASIEANQEFGFMKPQPCALSSWYRGSCLRTFLRVEPATNSMARIGQRKA